MPTKTTSTPVEDDLKTITNWEVFTKAKLIPKQIVCDTIQGHPSDEACHTKMPLRAANMLGHFPNHGGGFRITFRQTDGRVWPGWKELSTAGMELVGLKCEVCDKEIDLSVRELANHLRPHQGKYRQAWSLFKDVFFLRIQSNATKPVAVEDDDESYFEPSI